MAERLSLDRILSKLDACLHKNDYDAALRHLLYWLAEAKAAADRRTELALRNELMGLYRKQGQQTEATEMAAAALSLVEEMGIAHTVGAATTYLNAATVYKAFGMAERALPLYRQAQAVYESALAADDDRLAGLYNNMALALVDLAAYDEAEETYRRALAIVEAAPDGAPQAAITYLNLASAAEARLGLEAAEETIAACLQRAEDLLEGCENRDGDYAFVCEKCASVFGYYGYFAYAATLSERARRIYEGT